MKNVITLDEKRTLSIMKAINEGKYINRNRFLKSIGIEPNSFNDYLKKIAIKYPEKYYEYRLINDRNLTIFKESCEVIISKMAELIKNGVKMDDGTIREFDILDWYNIYYRYFDNVGRDVISEIIESRDKRLRGYSSRAVRTRELISFASGQSVGNISYKITEKHVLMDKTYNLTDEEKEQIVKYFNAFSIPYTYLTLDCAAKRIKNYGGYQKSDIMMPDDGCFKLRLRFK